MTPALQTGLLDAINPANGSLRALLREAGVARIDDFGWVRVTGEDRVRWLNGMVTNSIAGLTTGQGCFNFILSAQGRIQGTAYAYARADDLLLRTDRAQIPGLLALLDRFIIMDDVELTDISDTWAGLTVIGPKAASLLERCGLTVPDPAAPSLETVPWQTGEVILVTTHSPLVPRFELWADEAVIVALHDALTEAGAIPCDAATLETLRILEGTPRYGTDIRNSETAKELPQETAQPHALHFSKGCYLGQEIVERIHSRGNVHRAFTGFRLEGALPTPGTLLLANGKQVGELTSVAVIPSAAGTLQVALGYVRRGALGLLSYSGGEAFPTVVPFKDL